MNKNRKLLSRNSKQYFTSDKFGRHKDSVKHFSLVSPLHFVFLHQPLIACSFTQHDHAPKQFTLSLAQVSASQHPGSMLPGFPGLVCASGQAKAPTSSSALTQRNRRPPELRGQQSPGMVLAPSRDVGTWPCSPSAGRCCHGRRQPVVPT